jgi:predicted nucleic acid-binding protein
MKLAVDSTVLLSIFNKEPSAEEWLEALIDTRRHGRLAICDVVYAELAPAFLSQREFGAVLDKLGIQFDTIHAEAAWLAGQTFKAYRLAGGPREHMVPDFLIAAHARVQADRLAAIDRGYIRKYFPDLPLLRSP